MKISVHCTQCMFPVGEVGTEFRHYGSYVSINDLGVYEINCPNGHRTTVSVQGQRFELLFDLGFYAIADGYYREAVSSFTSSLERFYEFYIRLIALKHEIPFDIFEQGWRPLSKLSERQLGAFVVLYLLENNTPADLLSNTKIEFRNSVIHKGKIPTRVEAINYGKAVSELILPLLTHIVENDHDLVMTLVDQQLRTARAQAAAIESSVMALPFFLTLIQIEDIHRRDFELV